MDTYAVVGLGYVGLGLAASLCRANHVVGFDINQSRIDELKQQIDRNHLVEAKDLKHPQLSFSSDLSDIKAATCYFVAVSTPAIYYEFPDLSPLISATKLIAPIIKKGDLLIFESTVYPGTTEDVCQPLLEEGSGLIAGKDFYLAYSPERINPGDANHSLKNIAKIVSSQDPKTTKRVQSIYETICDNVYPVSSIPTAEAIKLLENTQRDVNIALMNEFTKVMHALNVDMQEVIAGAKTKFGFVPYSPGFVAVS